MGQTILLISCSKRDKMERSSLHLSQHCAHQASSSSAFTPATARHRPLGRRGPRRHASLLDHAISEVANLDLDSLSGTLSHMLTLGTLDPVLRMEQRVLTPQGLALVGMSLSYLFAKPGVLQGLVDTYISARLQRMKAKVYVREDFQIGRKIATGGFGTVYRAIATDPDTQEELPVVLKKATEFGEAEVWMNERIMRAAPNVAARFITAFQEGEGRAGDPLWLVWTDEGSSTLAELMVKKDFPANLEALLFERPLNIPAGADRSAATIRAAMQQLLEALQACHANGIVHRDVKPQNCIVSEGDRRVKLIDFGAAADLRIGINYVPNQYLLDPRYAPPEQYVMSAQTPKAPPAPVAAFLSPVLWQLNGPDRFDMYSAGITLLQLALPPLRSDSGLVSFNRQLGEQFGGDLQRWRKATERRGGKEWAEGFATLDALGGGGWDLAVKLVQYKAGDRLSAAAALSHPWFDPSPFYAVASQVETLTRAAVKVTEVDDGWLQRQMARSGTSEAGGFTEAQLKDELGFMTVAGKKELPAELANASATIAWWQQRQSDVQSRLKGRRKKGSGAPRQFKQQQQQAQRGGQRAALDLGGLLDLVGVKGGGREK